MNRYKFSDLCKIPKGEPLPPEVNSSVVKNLSAIFKTDTFIEALKDFDEKLRKNWPRSHGWFRVLDGEGKPVATGEYNRGIIKRYWLVGYEEKKLIPPYSLIKATEIWNSAVSFKKDKK